MEQQETTMVECILRISNPDEQFNRDIKVNIKEDLIENDSWRFEHIYSGASQTLLQKYLPQMKHEDTRISMLRPMAVDKDAFIEFLEDADTNKAKSDIDAILASFYQQIQELRY